MGCVATHRLYFRMCGSHIVCMCSGHSLRVNVPHKVSKCVIIRKGFQGVDTCCFYVWQPKFERICSHSKHSFQYVDTYVWHPMFERICCHIIHQNVSYTDMVYNLSTHIVSMCGNQSFKVCKAYIA